MLLKKEQLGFINLLLFQLQSCHRDMKNAADVNVLDGVSSILLTFCLGGEVGLFTNYQFKCLKVQLMPKHLPILFGLATLTLPILVKLDMLVLWTQEHQGLCFPPKNEAE